MKTMLKPVLMASALTLCILPASADDHLEDAVEARQAMFTLFGNYIGPLRDMARGKIDYDAAAAEKAAQSLAAVASIDVSGMWPQGSSIDDIDDTEAKANIWAELDEFMGGFEKLASASTSLATAAGGDLDSLRQVIGDVGKSCKGCHDNFREDD